MAARCTRYGQAQRHNGWMRPVLHPAMQRGDANATVITRRCSAPSDFGVSCLCAVPIQYPLLYVDDELRSAQFALEPLLASIDEPRRHLELVLGQFSIR